MEEELKSGKIKKAETGQQPCLTRIDHLALMMAGQKGVKLCLK